MRLDRRAAAIMVGGASVVAAVAGACGGDDDASSFDGSFDAGFGRDSGSPPPIFGDGGATGPASGVVIVHAAAFPAFRLCFEGYPELPPQPDSRVLPQSNRVGVEMGGVVRIGAMTRPPGRVYVIDQTEVSATPKDPTEHPCGELLTTAGFTAGKSYEVIGKLDEPLGTSQTAVLAITGCARSLWFSQLGISAADCGDYDSSVGNLRLVTFSLASTQQTTARTLPVALVSLSDLLDRERPKDQLIDITFGDLLDAGAGEPLGQKVASGPALVDASTNTVLELELGVETTFGSHGFRIAYRPADGGAFDAGPIDKDAAPPVISTIDQTLAEVQAISRPESNPTTYFLTPSNYALLLLGDPRIRKTLGDGGANPSFDARRALHFLAIAVREETERGTLGDIGPSTR